MSPQGDDTSHRNLQAQVLRIRRGDQQILATDDTYLAAGDVVEVVHPTARQQSVENYFGNSIQTASELDWVATALGLFAGFVLAVVPIPLPGGSTFEMGAAGGPLIIGLILGALRRTGAVAWELPMSFFARLCVSHPDTPTGRTPPDHEHHTGLHQRRDP